ncbi:hypothetical protein D3C80_2012720 [compost metagenome]
MHAVGTGPQFTGGLRTAQQQGGYHRQFGGRQFQLTEFRIAKTVFILDYPVTEAAQRSQKMFF